MANSDTNWQRVTCPPLFAAGLLAAVFVTGWAVTSASARELICLLARFCG